VGLRAARRRPLLSHQRDEFSALRRRQVRQQRQRLRGGVVLKAAPLVARLVEQLRDLRLIGLRLRELISGSVSWRI
jgi:hypothetical protein